MWLRRLPDDIREKAMTNYRNGYRIRSEYGYSKNPKVDSLSNAIADAFVWSDTPEGGDFWEKIHDEIQKKEEEAMRAESYSIRMPSFTYQSMRDLEDSWIQRLTTVDSSSGSSTANGILNFIVSSDTTYTHSTNADYTWRIASDGTFSED